MANLSHHGNNTKIQDFNCTTGLYGAQFKIVISAISGYLSMTACLGNILIIIAFQKVRSFHPPSRLLLSRLALTDLCVGLIAHLSMLEFGSPKSIPNFAIILQA